MAVVNDRIATQLQETGTAVSQSVEDLVLAALTIGVGNFNVEDLGYAQSWRLTVIPPENTTGEYDAFAER